MKYPHSLLAGFFALCLPALVLADKPVIEVYKSPYCGCCSKWEEHLEDHGFEVNSNPTESMHELKQRVGVPAGLGSCHTGVIDGYFIEGHVPAADIKSLLSRKPDIKGLTVPGMPAGQNVPGMETRPGNARFNVLQVDDSGPSVYSQYE